MGEHVIKLPDVGEGVAEAELVEWMAEVGANVREDDVIADGLQLLEAGVADVLQHELETAGITIPFPQRTLHIAGSKFFPMFVFLLLPMRLLVKISFALPFAFVRGLVHVAERAKRQYISRISYLNNIIFT